ncbi:cell division cycle 123-like protein [Brachionus plicatilis]|uniref:Cell division cycle 123-like protein n=1 Tax=Brachionus plicatilis TaxID=10195 RepID=A0A3M7P1M9_BRAPC|nr:cell division cycle 123-like protein [Brachionus plicatilis]
MSTLHIQNKFCECMSWRSIHSFIIYGKSQTDVQNLCKLRGNLVNNAILCVTSLISKMTDFLKQLTNAKLRQVEKNEIKDYSDPKLVGFLTKDSIETYQSSVLDCNFENWYQKLKDVTFRSELFPIEIEHAKLFLKCYPNIKINSEKDDWKSVFTSEELEILKDLETRLDFVISAFVKKSSDYVFVKTSSRSAKDSPLADKKLKDIYTNYLNELNEEEKVTENQKVICLLRAAFECLKVHKACQVLEMFFKSERIYQDMLLAIEKIDRFRENFIVREFVPIDVDMEFRGFVFKQRLTALSQYNYLIYSKRLNEFKNQIEQECL